MFADLIGKGGHIRTVPIPDWVGKALQAWTSEAAITTGPIFRAINKAGRIPAHGFTPKVVWEVVRRGASMCGLSNVAPHDLRRTCARLCHQAGGELEQIQFLLGHVSVQTTERYLGCKQRLRDAVSDHIGIEPEVQSGRCKGDFPVRMRLTASPVAFLGTQSPAFQNVLWANLTIGDFTSRVERSRSWR